MNKINAYFRKGALLSLLSMAVLACSSEQVLPDDGKRKIPRSWTTPPGAKCN